MKPSGLYDSNTTELLERGAGAQSGLQVDRAIESEFQRRESVAQIDANEASQGVARATQERTKWTKYSAIAIAVFVVVMSIGTIF